MNILITILICIVFSYFIRLLAKRIHLSDFIGLMIGGIFIGSFIFKPLLDPNIEIITILGEIGFIFLMFLAGLEVSWSVISREKKNSICIAAFAAFTPFLIGFAAFTVMGFDILTSLTVGICMGITAEATKANVLLKMRKIRTRLASIMLGAGIIDDMIGLFMFTIVSYVFTLTFVTQEFVMHFMALAAYLIGVTTHKIIGRHKKEIMVFEKLSLALIVPFFFITMGIYFTSQSIIQNPVLLAAIIVFAISGKMLGSLLTKPFTGLNLKRLYLIGWGMNSRGAVEFAIAFLALRMGLITTEIYSSLIIMALVTTLLFPLFFRRMVKRNPRIMG